MANDAEGKSLQNGNECHVVAGTHKDKAGVVEDHHGAPRRRRPDQDPGQERAPGPSLVHPLFCITLNVLSSLSTKMA